MSEWYLSQDVYPHSLRGFVPKQPDVQFNQIADNNVHHFLYLYSCWQPVGQQGML